MRTQRNLPGIRNGSVAKRQTRSKNPSTSKAFREFGVTKSSSRLTSNRGLTRAKNRGNGRHGEGRGSRVMWMMILIGVILSAGFVFALRSQINIHRLGQAEEQLRVKLDEYSSQQKFLALDQQRALNTGESDRASRQSGLDQLKLDGGDALRSVSVQRIVHQVPSPIRPSQAGQSNRLNGNGQNSLRSINQPVKPNPLTRATRVIKVVKAVKAEKAVKSNAAKSGAVKSGAVKSGAAKSNSAANRLKANVVKAKKQR